jgi:hypothetical protein
VVARQTGKLSDDDFKAAVRAEIAAAAPSGDLVKGRSKALDYYHSRMDAYFPPRDGFSKATSSDVQDTIESLMPSLMEIFTGGDEIARFEPYSEEDEEGAQQETDAVNYVINVENDGFTLIYDSCKDALLLKTGAIKHWWEKKVEKTREEYEGITPEGEALLLADSAVEAIERTERADGLIDIVIIRKEDKGRVRVEAVPNEEFLIVGNTRSMATARSAWHRRRLPASDLVAMGFPVDQVDKLPAYSAAKTEESTKRDRDEDAEDTDKDADANWAMREVEVYEGFVRADRDGDGIAEQIKVTCDDAAGVILEEEPFVGSLFSVGSPIRQPHRVIGVSLADLVMELQDIQTALTQGVLNNIYRVNAPRTEVPDDAQNEDTLTDLLRQDPGGYVRTKTGGLIREIATQPMAQFALPIMEMMHGKREERTGVTRYNQGVNADSLNKTASGITQIMSASQMRIRLIARLLAETLFKDTMLAVHGLIQRHDRVKRTLKLRNKWVEVDPAEWRERSNMTVTVGLGTGSREASLATLREILGMQMKAIEMQRGVQGPLIKLQHVHHTFKKLIETAGYRGADAFVAEPPPDWQPPPQPNPEMEKAKADAELEKYKADKDAEVEIYKAQLKAWVEQYDAWMRARVGALVPVEPPPAPPMPPRTGPQLPPHQMAQPMAMPA